MLNILTRPPKTFFKGAGTYYLKQIAKKILNKKRGPDGVLDSLKRGLDELGFPFVMNAKIEKGQTVSVLSNIEALRHAIEKKRQIGFDTLVAGPNLIVYPDEHDGLLASPEIDIVLAVSPWVEELYGKIIPALSPKMKIWPAGVKVPPESADEKKEGSPCIVFRKKAPALLYEKVIKSLDEKGIAHVTFEYGRFKQREYFDALRIAPFMIYLQESESQGIALQEAWIRNVPTLAWNKGSYSTPSGITVTGNVAAPFLTPDAGMLFEDEKGSGEGFGGALDAFVRNIDAGAYSPREYCQKTLSDKASAEAYLRAIGAMPR